VLGFGFAYSANRDIRKELKMTNFKVFTMTATLLFLISPTVYSQGMTEYGRTLGGVSQRKENAPPKTSKAPTQNTKGKGVLQGVGDLGGPAVPSGIIIVSGQAGLYPRQDDEAEKIDQLFEGDRLVPMVQSIGGSNWYMVKTSKGLIGWVKSADIRQETIKKQ
jgi:hypothetical protein